MLVVGSKDCTVNVLLRLLLLESLVVQLLELSLLVLPIGFKLVHRFD